MIAGIAPATQQSRIPYGRHLDESGGSERLFGYRLPVGCRPGANFPNLRAAGLALIPQPTTRYAGTRPVGHRRRGFSSSHPITYHHHQLPKVNDLDIRPGAGQALGDEAAMAALW